MRLPPPPIALRARVARIAFFALSTGCAVAGLAVAGCSSSPHPGMAEGAEGGGPSIDIPDPDGGVEWDGWAGEFVADYCVKCHEPSAPCMGSGCHPTAGPLPDFTIHSTVAGYGPTIRCGVAVTQDPSWQCGAVTVEEFPVVSPDDPQPTDAQRGIFVDWVNAGCP